MLKQLPLTPTPTSPPLHSTLTPTPTLRSTLRPTLRSTLRSTLFYTTPLCSTLLYSLLLCSALLCTLRYSTLLYSTPLCSTLLYSALFCSLLLYSALFRSSLLCSTLLYSTLFYSTLLNIPFFSTLLYSMLLYSNVLYSIWYCMFYANLHKSLEVSKLICVGCRIGWTVIAPIVLFWRCQLDYLSARFPLIEERFCPAENVQSAHCPPSVYSVMLTAYKTNLILLTKINALLVCIQVLAKTIPYPKLCSNHFNLYTVFLQEFVNSQISPNTYYSGYKYVPKLPSK